MRKILSVIFSLLLICSLAVSASAAEGFIYCEAQNLITVELNDQHLALGELSQKTGVQFEMYFMTCTDEPIPMDALGEVLYENKEQQPEEYVAVLLQVGQDETGWYLDETYPWDMIAKGSIAQDTAFMSALEVILDSLITTDNWSGPLAEDQMVATLTATALVEAADQLLAEQSAPATPYVIDDARLLTIEQRQELNAYAEKITETYGMGIYIMSVKDFHNYGEEPQIFDVLWNYYHDNSLGYGADRQGMILMLSMAERDFATFFYGEDTEYAFAGSRQEQLETYFLDNFGSDDWYGGFLDYLTASEEFMAQAAVEQSAPATPYVIDDARLLTIEQRQELNTYAEKITETYGVGIYIMSVEDFHNYGEEPQIFDVLWNYYHDNSLGYGADRQGMILMLSIAERDFATFFYGEDTEYAFNGFGQAQLENYFLDDFGSDDWYDGFMDFLTASEDFMAKAAAGEPVRDNPWSLASVFVLIALFVSFVVTRLLWMKMANVAAQKGAKRYQTAEGLVLTKQIDQFLTQTIRRRKIESSDSGSGRSGSSRAHSGGGGSGRSGKF